MEENSGSKIRDILIKGIGSAKNSIHIAVAYFSDLDIANLIKTRAKQGLRVEVIIYDHFVNSPVLLSLDSQNIKIYYYSPQNSLQICPNFCVIDEELLFTGDHGWAYAAIRTEDPEPMIVNNEGGLISDYLNKFNSFKNICGSRAFSSF